MQQGIGHPKPALGVSPGCSQFRLVFSDILIGAVSGDCITLPRAIEAPLESPVPGNPLVRKNSAITPPTYAQTGGIRHSLRHRVVHSGENVLAILVSPVGPDRGREFLSPAGAAAGIGGHHSKPLGGE